MFKYIIKRTKYLKLNFLFQIVVTFLLTATLSILVINNMMTGEVVYTSEQVRSVYVPPQEVSQNAKNSYSMTQISVFQFLVSFFIATSLMLLFLKKFKGKFMFEVFFSGMIIFGAQGPFGLFFPKIYAFFISIVLIVLRFVCPRIWTQNIVIIIGIAGVSASLGASVNPIFAILILILLSIYDIIAVYKTHHMVKLFKGMAKKGAVLALVIPKSFSLWKEKFSIIKPEKMNEFIFLGTGDIALPLFFAISAFSYGLRFSIAIIIGAVIGLVVDHFIFVTQKENKAIPALPAVAFFSIIGYITVYFLFPIS